MSHIYDNIISIENLLEAWKEFLNGKRHRPDVQEFGRNLMGNIIRLHRDLAGKAYKHSDYEAFKISDPKPRDIHKASVRDRLLHHAIHRKLSPFFFKRFGADSYSCQIGKGTHRALRRFDKFSREVSQNNTRTAWALKCDIKKFFASINHNILLQILEKHIDDRDTIWLLNRVITSFPKGLPLGNLTSQLLVNIYMNEFDQFVKHKLKVKYYLRYADDFVFLSESKDYLPTVYRYIDGFLKTNLKLSPHEKKVFLTTLSSGVDFLGWVHFPTHRVLRTVTKRRMLKNLAHNPSRETKASYLGLLKHGNTYKLQTKI